MFGNITLLNSSNSHFDALAIILKNPKALDTAMLNGVCGAQCALNAVRSHGLLSSSRACVFFSGPHAPAGSWNAVP